MASTLALRGISRKFGSIQALSEVEFTLEQGEIHALLGENGAGKSTLMKIAYGLIQPDSGRIEIGGTPAVVRNPTDARRLGLGMVHQHFTSIPAFTVAENVALAGGWRVSPRAAEARVRQLAAETGFALDPTLRVADLSAGLKQRLEVLKALAAEAKVLLLDEPTSVLSPPDADALLEQVGEFRRRGVSTVLITHKLREAIEVADRVTVLRRGRVVFSGAVKGNSAESLARHMLGESPATSMPGRGTAASSQTLGRLTNLSVGRIGSSGSGLHEATLQLLAGEVVGVAAVEGNGQRELFRAFAGLAKPISGRVELFGKVAFVPEDRSAEGVIGEFSLTENLVLSQAASAEWIRWPWINWEKARMRAGELIEGFQVRASGAEARAASLSGGNQQRMVIAEALERKPAVLLAENPTRGLDFKATQDIMDRLRQAAGSGMAVLVHLPDLDDLLEIATRVVVLNQGRLIEMSPGSTRDQIGRRMLGVGTA